jgi:hypothetical protein
MNEYAGRQVTNDVEISADDIEPSLTAFLESTKRKSPEERPARTEAGTVWQSSGIRRISLALWRRAGDGGVAERMRSNKAKGARCLAPLVNWTKQAIGERHNHLAVEAGCRSSTLSDRSPGRRGSAPNSATLTIARVFQRPGPLGKAARLLAAIRSQ